MRIEINFNLLIYNLNKEFPVLDFSCLNPSSVLGVLNLYCLYVYVHIVVFVLFHSIGKKIVNVNNNAV